MNEKKNAHQRGLKILGVISVTFFLFAFSLTAFSQDSTPSESKVELADGKIRIVYAFDAPVVASTSQMDDTLLAKTHKIIFDEENSWAQTYSVESIQAAENLLGIDFLISRNIENTRLTRTRKTHLVCRQQNRVRLRTLPILVIAHIMVTVSPLLRIQYGMEVP